MLRMNGDLVTHPQRGDVHPSGPAVVTNHQEDCGDPTEHADGERCHPAHLEAASESEPREAGGWRLEAGSDLRTPHSEFRTRQRRPRHRVRRLGDELTGEGGIGQPREAEGDDRQSEQRSDPRPLRHHGGLRRARLSATIDFGWRDREVALLQHASNAVRIIAEQDIQSTLDRAAQVVIELRRRQGLTQSGKLIAAEAEEDTSALIPRQAIGLVCRRIESIELELQRGKLIELLGVLGRAGHDVVTRYLSGVPRHHREPPSSRFLQQRLTQPVIVAEGHPSRRLGLRFREHRRNILSLFGVASIRRVWPLRGTHKRLLPSDGRCNLPCHVPPRRPVRTKRHVIERNARRPRRVQTHVARSGAGPRRRCRRRRGEGAWR